MFIPIITCAAILSIIFNCIYSIKPDAIVATVNGEPINVKEFRQRLAEDRAGIYDYFKKKYDAENNADFWTTEHNGEIPIVKARENALKGLTRIKIQQILMKQKGLISDISYEGFLQELKNENKRRQKAVRNKSPIFGPLQYGEREYFSYLFSNNVLQLKEIMANNEYKTGDDALKSYYYSIRDKYYKNADIIKVLIIYISLFNEKGNSENYSKEDAIAVMKKIKVKIDKGKNIDDVLKYYSENKLIGVNSKEQTFDESTARNDNRLYPELLTAAAALSVGQVSEVIEAEGSISMVKCLDRRAGGYKPFEVVKDNIKSVYMDKKYEELIDKLVIKAKVDIKNNVYERIMVK